LTAWRFWGEHPRVVPLEAVLIVSLWQWLGSREPVISAERKRKIAAARKSRSLARSGRRAQHAAPLRTGQRLDVLGKTGYDSSAFGGG